MILTNGLMRYNCSIVDLYDRSVDASENSSFITSSLAARTLEKVLSSAKATSKNLVLFSNQRNSVYFRRVCAPLPEVRDLSKHKPCGLSV